MPTSVFADRENKFMHDYPKKNNVSHLFDLAFNSERSIEDELGTIHYLQLNPNFDPTLILVQTLFYPIFSAILKYNN